MTPGGKTYDVVIIGSIGVNPKGGPNPFIDPEGYKKEIDVNEQAFTLRRAEQLKAQ